MTVAISSFTVAPHTRIENTVIDESTPQIGLAGLGVLVLIKRYLNQKTGQCNPSYKTLARKAGVDRSTIIRYVKKLKAYNLIDPELQFKEDGSHASNQYHFSSSRFCATPPETPHQQNSEDQGGAPVPPPQAQECHSSGGSPATTPGAAVPPEQDVSNKKERTKTEDNCMATEKQKTCQHPLPIIMVLPDDNLRICLHCFGLLDENLNLIVEEDGTAESVAA